MDATGVTSMPSHSPRRTAVWVAAVFVAGILSHPLLAPSPIIHVVLLAMTCLSATIAFRRESLCAALLLVGLFIAGRLLAQLEHYQFPTNHISAFAGDLPRLARLEIELIDPPRMLINGFGEFRGLPPRSFVRAKALRLQTWSGWIPCGGELIVQIAEPHPKLSQGQIARVLGHLQRPGDSMNPGQFDWAWHYRGQRVLATLHVPHSGNIEVLEQRGLSPLEILRHHVRRILARGFQADDALDHALLRALLLGDRDTQLQDVQEQFRRTGTGHHLAISGLHVAVLGGVVLMVCRLACLPARAAAFVTLGFIMLYGAVALPSPPVIRSVLLCAAYVLGVTHRRSVDAIQLLALCALTMLIMQPLDVYDAGFQLSFCTVAALALFSGPVRQWIDLSFRDDDHRVLESLAPITRWQAVRREARRYGVATLAAAVVAWIASAPLIAFHFQQINPWAIPGGILLAPIVFLALIGGALKVMLTMLWPGAAELWASIAVMPVAAMRGGVDALAALPGADVPLAAHWRWTFLSLYLLLLMRALPCRVPARWLRNIPVAACLMLPMLPLLLGLSSRENARQSVRVTTLAVGAGSCNVIELPGGRVVLIDCGSNTLFDLTRKCLGPYLRHFGYARVERIFLSHANYDHFSAAEDVIEAYDVSQVGMSALFAAHSTDNPPARQLLRRLEQSNVMTRHFSRDQIIPLDESNVRLQVLWPPADEGLSANDASMVMRLTCYGRSILFTGDIQSAAMRQLLKQPGKLKSDILIAPHHGSMEEATSDFIAAVDPDVIISSNDRVLSTRQKRLDESLASQPRRHYRTHRSGAVSVEIDRYGVLELSTFRGGR